MPETRTLTCLLTPAEVEARGKELARATFDWEAAEEEKKSVVKDLGDKIKEHEANMKRLSRVVRSGKEEREVEIEWRPYPESETMRLFRMDTGEEISSRPMTREEKETFRQPPLFKPAPAQLPPATFIAPTPPPTLQLEGKSDVIEGEFEEVDQ